MKSSRRLRVPKSTARLTCRFECLEDRAVPAALLHTWLPDDIGPQRLAEYGTAVAASDKYLLASAPQATVNGVTYAGQVYSISTDSGGLYSRLTAPILQFNRGFGEAVAIGGELAIVGSPTADAAGVFAAGAAYVYRAQTGELIASLNHSTPTSNARFGYSVALIGNIAAVGTPRDAGGGSVLLFNVNTGALLRTLTSPNPGNFQNFGYSLAASGPLLLVGAPSEDNVGAIGRAYAFEPISGGLVAEIANAAGFAGDQFGSAVALQGNTAVIGAPGNVSAPGRAIVANAVTGAQTAPIVNPFPDAGDRFGAAVSIAGSFVVGGAPNDDQGAADAGACYSFRANDGALQAIFSNGAPAAGDGFGKSVAAIGNACLVGIPKDDRDGKDGGGVNLHFIGSGGNFAPLLNPTPATEDLFGDVVALSTDYAAVSSADDDGAINAGAVSIFNPSTGAAIQKLRSPVTPAPGLQFGAALAWVGGGLLVGAPGDGLFSSGGTAYFMNPVNADVLTSVSNPGPVAGDRFGAAVAGTAGLLVVGAPGKDTGASDAGSIYVFHSTTGMLLRTIDNPAPAVNDNFGSCISMFGNALLVGTPLDDAGGVDSGSAYLFDATTGALLKTFDNPSPAMEDFFGHSVAIWGDRVLVGAYGDDSLAGNRGQAYLFDASSYGLVATLISTGKMFGVCVALSGDKALVSTRHRAEFAADFGDGVVTEFSAETGAFVGRFVDPRSEYYEDFGSGIAVLGDRTLIGARFSNAQDSTQGIAYLFSTRQAPGGASIVGRESTSGDWYVAVSQGGAFQTEYWATWSPAAEFVDVLTGDFNGDGYSDIVGRVDSTGDWYVGSSTGEGFATAQFAQWSPAVTWADVRVGDFNGDGKSDIVGRYAETGEWYVGISTGASFATALWAKWSANVTWVDVLVGDFNGDFVSDIVGRWKESGTWYVGLSTKFGFNTSFFARWSAAVTWVDVRVGRLDADFRWDVIGRALEFGDWYAGLSTGTAFATSYWARWSTAATWVDVNLGDVDNDGRADVIGRHREAGAWYVGRSTGTSLQTTLFAEWSATATWADVRVGDFDGDGRADIAGRHREVGTWYVGRSTGSAFQTSLWDFWSANVTWVDVAAANVV